jgi:hypothetical protein
MSKDERYPFGIPNGHAELSPEWQDYEQQVQALEAEGLTRSDAQGVVDAKDLKIGRDRTVGMVRPDGLYLSLADIESLICDDIMTCCAGFGRTPAKDDRFVTALCQIVVDRFKEFEDVGKRSEAESSA